MPSYDLLCSDCSHKFSVFCSISAKDQQRCPSCDSPNIKTRFTTVNVSGAGNKGGGSPSFSAPRTTGFG